jgi:hypothetical protein
VPIRRCTDVAFLLFAIGAALLAFWTVARFTSIGPQTVLSALIATAAAFLLMSPLPGIVASVAASKGVAAALLFVVLPSLTLLFWTTGCLVRSLVALAAPYRR